MKYLIIISLLVSATFSQAQVEQEPPPPPPPDQPPAQDMRPPRQGPQHRQLRGNARQGNHPGMKDQRPKHLERLMQHLKETNPQEFERLNQLKKDSPRAFSAELRNKVQQRVMHAELKDFPRLQAFLKTLTIEERGALHNSLKKSMANGPKKDRQSAQKKNNGKQAALTKGAQALSKEYKVASAEDQQRIAGKLKENLGQQFDLKGHDRSKKMEKLEKELGKIRKQMVKRAELREKIVERRFNELTKPEKAKQ